MKVLIIEDDASKLARLKEFILAEFRGSCVVSSGAFRSGMDSIKDDELDVVILDMALPTYETPSTDDDEFRFFAGKEILRQMERRGIAIPVIIVTQFESFGRGAARKSLGELKSELEGRFRKSYRGTIYYNAALESWKDELRVLLNDVMKKGRGASA